MYQSTSQDQLTKLLMSQNQQERHTVKVNGRAGAEAYNLPPNSDELLLDLNDPIVWFVQTDGAGYKTVIPYDIAPHKEVTQKDILQSLDQRIAKLEEVILNGKSDNSATAKSKSERNNDAGNRSNVQG